MGDNTLYVLRYVLRYFQNATPLLVIADATDLLLFRSRHVLTEGRELCIGYVRLCANLHPSCAERLMTTSCLPLVRSFLTSISFVPNPSLYPEPPVQGYAAAALGAVALSQVCRFESCIPAAGQLGATCICCCHTAEPGMHLPIDLVHAETLQQEHQRSSTDCVSAS